MVSWSRPTYPRRLFLWLLGYSVLLVGCFLIFQYHREKQFKAAELDSRLQIVNSFLLNELASGKDIGEIDLTPAKKFGELRVSVFDRHGNVEFDNTLDAMAQKNHLDREEIKKALRSGSGYTVRRHSESTGDTYFYSATRGSDGHIVRSAVPYSVSLSTFLGVDYGFMWIMGSVAIAMCVLGFYATRRLGQHISRLNRFARGVERGERISDNEPFPHDELGEISNHIVRLYADLQQATADRDSEHREAIRQQQEKERIKKQLTNNINHELKTPVASIRVCLETLLAHSDLPDAKRAEFLQRSLDNTLRLENLLADVATITRMDEGCEAISRDNLDLGAVISRVCDDSRLRAAEKGIEIANRVDREINVCGNESLLSSVFQNLINNAVAYSGGTCIEIDITSCDESRVVLRVRDNGTGVESRHLPHIFERFYRVDKGRSRAAGGTGLGLSIVRNAVVFHCGEISVDNRATGGLEFRIVFPLASTPA